MQEQQFHLVVTPQESRANDNVKGGGVQHFALLGYPFMAQTNGHMYPPSPRKFIVLPSPTLKATVLVFQILPCVSNLRGAMDSVAPVS